MKTTATLALIVALTASGSVLAQPTGMKDMEMKKCMDMKDMGMKGMEMKGMDMKGMDMKGMDMKGMDAQKCQDMMKNMEKKSPAMGGKAMTYSADALVKEIDADNGKVKLDHGPVKSLGWPAMTMGFAVKNKMLFNKLAVGKKVHIKFKKQEGEYVITSVK